MGCGLLLKNKEDKDWVSQRGKGLFRNSECSFTCFQEVDKLAGKEMKVGILSFSSRPVALANKSSCFLQMFWETLRFYLRSTHDEYLH